MRQYKGLFIDDPMHMSPSGQNSLFELLPLEGFASFGTALFDAPCYAWNNICIIKRRVSSCFWFVKSEIAQLYI